MDPACAVSRIGTLPIAGGAPIGDTPMPMFLSANPSSCGRGLCMIGVLVIILLGIWFFWTPSHRGGHPGRNALDAYGAGSALQGADVPGVAVPAQGDLGDANPPPKIAKKAALPSDRRPFNQPEGSLPGSQAPLTGQTGKCQNPQSPEPMTASSGAQSTTMPSVPSSLAEAPRVSAATAGDGGWTLDATTFAPSQDSEDYYKHFKPVSLESTMPMGWRAAQQPGKCAAGEENLYSEFSRYAISPNQMKRAENMRSVLRLGELSRDGLSRTLGQRSLLRDFITPLGPNPVGDSAMLWNDSSVRQNYIAAATGRFPSVSESC